MMISLLIVRFVVMILLLNEAVARKSPTLIPTLSPTTRLPTQTPSKRPSFKPSTLKPSRKPSRSPTIVPNRSLQPSVQASGKKPTMKPTTSSDQGGKWVTDYVYVDSKCINLNFGAGWKTGICVSNGLQQYRMYDCSGGVPYHSVYSDNACMNVVSKIPVGLPCTGGTTSFCSKSSVAPVPADSAVVYVYLDGQCQSPSLYIATLNDHCQTFIGVKYQYPNMVFYKALDCSGTPTMMINMEYCLAGQQMFYVASSTMTSLGTTTTRNESTTITPSFVTIRGQITIGNIQPTTNDSFTAEELQLIHRCLLQTISFMLNVSGQYFIQSTDDLTNSDNFHEISLSFSLSGPLEEIFQRKEINSISSHVETKLNEIHDDLDLIGLLRLALRGNRASTELQSSLVSSTYEGVEISIEVPEPILPGEKIHRHSKTAWIAFVIGVVIMAVLASHVKEWEFRNKSPLADYSSLSLREGEEEKVDYPM